MIIHFASFQHRRLCLVSHFNRVFSQINKILSLFFFIIKSPLFEAIEYAKTNFSFECVNEDKKNVLLFFF